MAQQQSPWLEAKYGWNFGESNWNTGVDENLLKFSFLFDRNVDGVVSTLPAAVNGKAYFLTTDNRLYFTVNTTYFSCPTPKWFEFVVRGTGVTYQFNGTSVIQVESLIGVDSRLDAVELSISSLGTASSKDVDFFASTSRVDVVEANAQSTTDRAVQVVGDYAAGLVLSNSNQGFRYLGDIYLPGNGVTLPYTTTGVGAGEIATFRSVGDAMLRSDLAAAGGSGIVTYKSPYSGTYAISLEKQLQYNALPSVLDFMTDAERFAVTTNTWTTVTNVSSACQLAVDTHTSVVFPKGFYKLSSPLNLKSPKQCIYGHGSGVTSIKPADVFSSATIGGVVRRSLICYQPPGAAGDLSTSVIGGEISDLTLNCEYPDSSIDGIIFDRVNQSQAVRNVHIYKPNSGIKNYWGWCHTYENVYVQGAKLVSILLDNGSNGTSINGCFLFGWNYATDRTQVHVDVRFGSIGNSISGGAIELCDAGVQVAGDGQIAIHGTDFEEVKYRFITAIGTYSGTTLIKAGLPTVATGCSFVGVPYGGGIVSEGTCVALNECSFINNDALPAGVDEYALWGIQAGQNLTGLQGSGVSAKNCTFIGWGDNLTGRIKRGVVNTVYVGKVSAEDVEVPVGTWTPSLVNFTTTGTVVISDAKYVKTGKLIYFTCKISATTIATTGYDSNVTGLPFLPAVSNTAGIISAVATKPSTALVQPNGNIYPPTDASWGSTMVISGTYLSV